jgi:uncharacterized protein YjbI with pentapeptide repeats
MGEQSTLSSILTRYAAGERSFVSLDLDDRPYDFSGAALVGADFTGCFITANFRGADLQDAVFKEANVKTCDFTGANLRGASFVGAAIDGAVFIGANLTGTSFLGASEQGHVYGASELPSTDAL